MAEFGTFTQEYDAAYAATTRDDSQKMLHDQVFWKHVFMYWLEKLGRGNADGGGRDGKIERRVQVAKATGGKTFGRGASFDLNDPKVTSVAVFNWGQLGHSLTRYYQDELENRGKAKILDIVSTNVANTLGVLKDLAAEQLVAETPADSLSLNGIGYFVSATPTSAGTIAGIDQVAHDFWQNQVLSMSGLAATAYLDKYMFDLWLAISKWGSVDYIITDPTTFSLYNDVTSDMRIISDARMGDAQFQKLGWKGIPVVCDHDIPSGNLFMLDSTDWEYVRDSAAYFKWTEWKAIPTKLDKVAQLIMRAQLLCTKRRSQGRLTNIAA